MVTITRTRTTARSACTATARRPTTGSASVLDSNIYPDKRLGKTAYVNGTKLTGTEEEVVQNVEFVEMTEFDILQKNVKKVTIPNNVTSIGYGAFSGCSSLTSITIPDSVTSIGRCAFYDCSNLASIIIPDSVKYIYQAACYNCTSLAHIYYKGTKEQWNAITKGTNWNLEMGSNVTGGTTIHYNYVPE